ncbi:MAG: N-acetylmuramoyl-L-alanine amidase [Patescibacteria group bacterium]|nr:N-acetylmuramoyl-L-alanine amidase [Patescibacteria group bacterium]
MSNIKYIVIHDTEGPTAQSAASWFTNPASEGSAHLVVDDNVCYRTLANDIIPWAAPPLNETGFHIEIAGYANWSKLTWYRYFHRIRRAAYKAAWHCHLFKVPVRWVDVKGLEAGEHGITSHRAISAAFKQSTHTDPGPHFPYQMFMFFVKRYYRSIKRV